MKNAERITIISDKNEVELNVRTILYVLMHGNIASIHRSSAGTLETRMTLAQLEEMLGENFIKVKRNCLVSVFAIHNITDRINLCNGEELEYAQRNRQEILHRFHARQKSIISSFSGEDVPKTKKEYWEYYRVFDHMPFAFTDIEMVFDEKFRAVDWMFCYGNHALEELEKMPLEKMIGSTFSTLFPNMDVKWLRTYERATLFEEMLNIVDYSSEIHTNLNIICFPTFKGHCGCILLDIDKLKFFRRTNDTEKAISAFIGKLLD